MKSSTINFNAEGNGKRDSIRPLKRHFLRGKIAFILIALSCFATPVLSQYVYTIKADSVKITNCDSAELILENHTQGIHGFLYNTGNGRTIFQRGLFSLNDSLYQIGADTLNLSAAMGRLIGARNGLSISGGKIVLGSDPGDTSSALQSNRTIPASNKFIYLTNAATGDQASLSAAKIAVGTGGNASSIYKGFVDIEQNLSNAAGFGGMINVIGNLGFLNNTANETISSGTINCTMNYTPTGTNSQANITSSSVAVSDYFAPSGAGNFSYTGMTINPFYDFSSYGTATNENRDVRGIYYNPFVFGTIPYRHVAYENTNGDNIFNSGAWGNTANMGKAGFHGISQPTAYVQIGAGAAAAGSAPLKLTAGTNLSSPEDGAIEYDGTNLYFTVGTTRYTVQKSTGGASNDIIHSSLAVNGTIRARRLKLGQETDWPDYVFGKNYPLTPLSQLAEYIAQHRHLPGIPSAAEAGKQGVDVGDMQAALLKKIEELTLYNIEQGKKLGEQQAQLAQQDKKLESLQQEIEVLKKMMAEQHAK